MCGIAGIWGDGPRLEDVRKMATLLHHRGPDGQGIHTSANGSIASTRLAIMDPAGGQQPIYSEDKTAVIVANGEIYNFPALRKELENRFTFHSGSDSEVILRLYERDGIAAIPKLQGMFGLAIVDNEKLILARDPYGIKPLYYGMLTTPEGNEVCYFASEIKALLPFDVDVKSLPPGSTFSPGEGVQKYFTAPRGWIDDPDAPQPSEAEIRGTLEKAVASHLMSDVPVGVFLSGGLDSSLVAAMVRPHVKELHTFAVGLPGSDDLEAARACADHIGSLHHERIFTQEDILKKLPKVIQHIESYDPFLVRAAIANYFCAELAAQHLKVVLTGEGADELYAGYEYHKKYRSAKNLHEELYRSTSALHQTNLQRTDRITMAHSLEARVPFLDADVVRCAMRVSPHRKLVRSRPWSRRVEKFALRKACLGVLPEKLLWRPKQTFNRGAGIDKILIELLKPQTGKRSFTEYKRLFPHDKINSPEAMVYHDLLSRDCEGSRAMMDNVFVWAANIVKDDGVNPLQRRFRVLRLSRA